MAVVASCHRLHAPKVPEVLVEAAEKRTTHFAFSGSPNKGWHRPPSSPLPGTLGLHPGVVRQLADQLTRPKGVAVADPVGLDDGPHLGLDVQLRHQDEERPQVDAEQGGALPSSQRPLAVPLDELPDVVGEEQDPPRTRSLSFTLPSINVVVVCASLEV